MFANWAILRRRFCELYDLGLIVVANFGAQFGMFTLSASASLAAPAPAARQPRPRPLGRSSVVARACRNGAQTIPRMGYMHVGVYRCACASNSPRPEALAARGASLGVAALGHCACGATQIVGVGRAGAWVGAGGEWPRQRQGCCQGSSSHDYETLL